VVVKNGYRKNLDGEHYRCSYDFYNRFAGGKQRKTEGRNAINGMGIARSPAHRA
jgi:hypothetical protein